MKFLEGASRIAVQNLRKWRTDYRVWIIGVLLCVMVWIFVDDINKAAGFMGTKPPIWIFPFIYSQFYMKLVYTFMVVLLFCNAPFTDSNQIFVYTRTSRAQWLFGQVLYIMAASAIFYLFLFAVSILSTIFTGELSFEWGKTLNSVTGDVAAAVGANFLYVSNIIIKYFTPLQACSFTFLTSWCSAVLIGLTIFFCNLVSGTNFLGILVSSVMVIISAVLSDYKSLLSNLLMFSPISWNTLNNIDVGGKTQNPSFAYCMCVYAGLIAALIIAILVFGRKKSLDVKGDQ